MRLHYTMMQKLSLTLLSALTLVLTAACSDEPVSYSEPVGLKLSLSSGDVESGSLLDEKNINTESGNPYGAFVARAQAEVGGTPSRIAVEDATLALDATSNNVTALTQVFGGEIKVAFVMNGSETSHSVANLTLESDTAAGPAAMAVSFDSDGMADPEYTELVGGSFKTVLSGPAAAGFAALNADADLSLVLTFTAYE